MRIQMKILVAAVFITLFTVQKATAQNGMDNAGISPARYSRLHRAALPLLQFQQNEKAIGVYTNDFNPSSTLEINTTTAYLPFLHPNLAGDRGLVFRSVAPTGFTQQWQMFRDNDQMFRLFNAQGTDDVTLETVQNGAMRFNTNSTQRIHVNGDRPSTEIGDAAGKFIVNTSGFVGIGPNTQQQSLGLLWDVIGPFTLLHLHGVTLPNDFAQDWGYRNWMKTGVSFTDQTDFSYVGNRSVDPSTNLNEFTISWSNDGGAFPTPTPPHGGPDDMVFRFTSAYEGPDVVDPDDGSGSTLKGSTDFTKSNDIDGRHIARFTPAGFFGLGPNFGHTFDNVAHVRPQSMFHMSTFEQEEAWFQITNQTGTEETANDGLRIGITTTGTAHIKQQENLPLIFYTNNLSTARIVPEQSSYITSLSIANPGMMGIGDFSTPSLPIDAKLDIDGDLRIRLVEEKNTLTRVLVVDENDQNRVFYRSVDDLGTDDQNLTLTGTILSIEDGNSVDLSSLDTDTDQQTLSFNGSGELCISGGNCVPLPPGGGGAVAAQNGLNTNISGTGAVELGGSLLHNTTVNMSGKNLELSTLNHGNLSLGDNPAILGSASLNRNIAIGRGNLMSDALQSFTYGLNNEISGGSIYSAQHGNHAFGFENKIVGGAKNIAIGSRNEIKNTSLINGPTPSDCFLFGYYNVARNTGNVLVGRFVPSPYNGLVSIGNANELRRNIVLNYADNGGSFNTAHIDPTVLSSQAIPAINIDQFNRIGVGKYAPSCALDVVGSICATGSITPSDSTMKTNINPLTNTLYLINQLRPISYEWVNKTDTFMYGTQYGFTAQQVETVIPDLVHLGLDGKKVLNYTGLFAFLTQGIKEQQKTIDSMETTIQQQDSINNDLETRLAYLENCIRNANICTEGNRTMNTEPSNTTNYKSVELTNVNSIILDQNLPNPFKENTVINYNIPTEVTEAKLLFYDLNGRIIKELIIDERGESKLTVYGTNLKTGVYTYSLIADGELIATKKMVKK